MWRQTCIIKSDIISSWNQEKEQISLSFLSTYESQKKISFCSKFIICLLYSTEKLFQNKRKTCYVLIELNREYFAKRCIYFYELNEIWYIESLFWKHWNKKCSQNEQYKCSVGILLLVFLLNIKIWTVRIWYDNTKYYCGTAHNSTI